MRGGSGEELADGLQRGLSVEPGDAGDRAVAGVDVCAPVGTKSAGDLAEHHRWPDFPFAGVVGRRHAGVFEEDEELGPPGLDRGLQVAAGRVCRGQSNERIEAALGAGVVLPQRRRLQRVSASTDADRPAQQIAQPWREGTSPQSMAYWTSRKTWARQT